MNVRKAALQLHKLIGLTSGLIMVVVALTGCVWAFEEEIRYLTQHERLFVQPKNAPRQPASQIITAVRQADPTLTITQIRFFGNPERAVQVFTSNKRLVTLNPFSAKVLSITEQEKDWLLINLSLHRTLLLGTIGKKIIYWNAWLFLTMLITGFVLWLPRRLSQLWASLQVKWQAKAARRTYDLHSVLGFYALPFLCMTVATGLSIASHGDKKKDKPVVYQSFSDATVVDKAISAILKNDPYETLRINLPKDSLNPLRLIVFYPTSGLRKESTFDMDPGTGQLLQAKLYDRMSFSERFWKSDYELHTGRILGMFGKCFVFILGLVTASLPITGFLMWQNKRRKHNTRRRSSRFKTVGA